MTPKPTPDFSEAVARKAERRARSRREGDRGVWFGLGMFGLVGWTVAIPSLLGLAIGLWLDSRWPGRVSWTITCLMVGVTIGCVGAWRWVKRESERE